MLYNCSVEEYVYPDCKLNSKIKKKIENLEDESDKRKLQKKKIKAGNYGYLREFGNRIKDLEDKEKKSLFISSKLITKLNFQKRRKMGFFQRKIPK